MGIKVKHEPGSGDLSAMIQMMAMAGAMQAKAPSPAIAPVGPQRPHWATPARPASAASRYAPSNADRLMQIRAARAAQERDIQAKADLQKQIAGQTAAKVALEHGLDQEIREQSLADQIEAMQEKAKLQSQQFEHQYTVEQKREFAKLNKARQYVQENESFTPEEKASALRQIDMQQAGIEPSLMPRDPNKPQFPEGQGPMDSWVDSESGAVMGLDRSLNRRILVPYDNTLEGVKAAEQHAIQLKRMELEQKQRDKMLEIRSKLATESIVEGEGDNKTMRNRSAQEIDAIMQTIEGGGMQQQAEPTGPWWESAEAGGMTVTDADKGLPPEVGFAQATIRHLSGKGDRDSLSPAEKEAWNSAQNMLLRYRTNLQKIRGF
jgi:hypothetical protein